MIKDVVVVAHNLRSCHNVGSILRTADGLGVTKVYFTGYTPYPKHKSNKDQRLPHLAAKMHTQIRKTALGAENTTAWIHNDDINSVISGLYQKGYFVCALEQTKLATTLVDFRSPAKIAIIVGNEVKGLDKDIVSACDSSLFIPMKGSKESFNVVQALAITLSYIYFS